MDSARLGELATVGTAFLWTFSAVAWTSAGRYLGALAVSFLRLAIISTTPVLILPFAILLYREKVSLRAAGGAALSVAGVALLAL